MTNVVTLKLPPSSFFPLDIYPVCVAIGYGISLWSLGSAVLGVFSSNFLWTPSLLACGGGVTNRKGFEGSCESVVKVA